MRDGCAIVEGIGRMYRPDFGVRDGFLEEDISKLRSSYDLDLVK